MIDTSFRVGSRPSLALFKHATEQKRVGQNDELSQRDRRRSRITPAVEYKYVEG